MADGTIRKRPFEVKDYSFGFSGELEAGETITLLSCVAINPTTGKDSSEAIISSTPAPAVIGQTVVFWLKDGMDGERYDIRIRVESSRGQKLEGDLDVFVVEE
jgi:hypothetical protein